MKGGDLVNITVPMIIQQLRYLRFKVLREKHISNDGLCILHDLAYSVPFVWAITSYFHGESMQQHYK